MATAHPTIPSRNEVDARFTWDLSRLYPDDTAWEAGLKELDAGIPRIESFKGTLGRSAKALRECLDYMMEIGKLDERLGHYAHLRMSEDAGNSANQDRFARYVAAATRAETIASYQTPEIQAIPQATMEGYLSSTELEGYGIYLRKILRFKPHVLSEQEERLLAMQAESNQTASKTFAALTDVDMEFGEIETPEGPKPLSQSTFSSFLIDPDREVRKSAYFQFYAGFDKHRNTLASLYSGSVQLDIYRAKARNYPSARAGALFPDDVPEAVYDNLVATVSNNLRPLHAYYDLRRKLLGVDVLRHYDVYVPLIKDISVHHTYEEAVELVIPALAPLGDEYCTVLKKGLLGGWVDRYENKGKRSGAFSAGSYVGDPYILMNYKSDVLRDVFTLAHEGGHSMHSYFSAAANPFQHYSYTIFEAEVASTLNEQLLALHLIGNAESREMKAYLVGKQVDDIIATVYRQTMFAEFEHLAHSTVERGGALTVDSLRAMYRGLLDKYFGGRVTLEEVSDLEGLRIPHFYRGFYVYKYATGLSAAIALAGRILDGGAKEREAYLAFLHSGGSRYPLESLRLAGVDMASPQPVERALESFTRLVGELEALI
ncbi:MAG TPA: oligoendopeptidase F [Spirochaetia bacterium]|nr:oligoendopeptidase F [Spirochaetia bacterium]HUZ17447.1 oligoendopeptidase F [Spirochaetia bacterium]